MDMDKKCKPVSFIYSHGFGSTSEKATSYVKSDIIPDDVIRFNYQDADLKFEPIKGIGIGLKLWKSCIGQEDDIKRLADQIKRVIDKDLVLFGESRGSSAIINYLGSASYSKNIKAVVVDSPFDTMQNVLFHRLNRFYLDKIISPATVEKYLPYIVTQYKVDGLLPIKSIKNVPNNLPILFICSKEDKVVPHTSSIELYKKLRAQGHDKAHILIVDHGAHAWLMTGKSKEVYLNVVHAFYKKYGIEHNSDYADYGKEMFDKCQPNFFEKS
jgi:fermentation-respiration switch protein FrsA (DUF1100 family)